jgi:regulator of sigma E protease
MSSFFGAAFWFVVTLGVLVTFHEFGHFWVARRCGVRVLKFSVGFGRPLWSRVGADGTTYQVAMIPLGGYVLFLDEREQEVRPAERDSAFNRKPVWQRILVVAAGPVANLILCVALLWVAMQMGRPELAPQLGETRGLAAEAGLAEGDRLVAVSGQAVDSWESAALPLALAAIDREPVTVAVQDAHGARREVTLRLDRLAADFDQTDPLKAIGVVPALANDKPLVGSVSEGFPAAGHLMPGDRIVAVGERPIARWSEIRPAMAAAVAAAHGAPVQVQYERNGRRGSVALQPRQAVVAGVPVWQIGVGAQLNLSTQRYAPWPAFRAALAETRKQAGEMLGFIARLVTGKASAKNLSGVIGIAQVVHSEANVGMSSLIWIMASLSLTLCVMNLLPIPVLDGGHLLYYLIELISGRPVGERVLLAGQYAGLLLLAGLIGLAFYNDLARIFS